MSTHSSKAKSRQVKTTIKDTNFWCVFNKTMQVKIKYSKTINKVNDVRAKLPLQKSSFSPATAPEN
jgi:hypothetical protein